MAGMTDCFELECLLSGPLGGRRPGAGLSIKRYDCFRFVWSSGYNFVKKNCGG